MPNMPDFEALSMQVKTFTDNPTPMNRMALRNEIAPFQEENESFYSAAASHALAGLDNAYLTIGQIHGVFVEAANMAGVEPSTLGGGNTPEV
jgi:hypothetical protein